MAEAEHPEPKQTTGKGYEIPVPKRKDFFRDLRKVAPKVEPDDSGAPEPPEEQQP